MSPFLLSNTDMTISHASITDPNLHEPKGVSTAAANTAYVSNGAGSGAWSKIPTQGLAGISANGTANQVVVVDGAGAFNLQWPVSHGFCYFFNSGTPAVITYPSTYTKVAPTTTPSGTPKEFTEGTNARLTYTGALPRHAIIEASATLAQSSGADRDIRIAIYKNGILLPASEDLLTANSGIKRQVSTICSTNCSQNDYFEMFIRNEGASGDVSVYSVKLSVRAFLS